MKCKIHPDNEAVAVCEKFGIGYCRECCDELGLYEGCACSSPRQHCRFRPMCLIWELSKEKSRIKRRREEYRTDGSYSH